MSRDPPLGRQQRVFLRDAFERDAKDYRYFPDGSAAGAHSDEWIDRIVKSCGIPAGKQARYVEQYGLPQYDAGILTGSNCPISLRRRRRSAANRKSGKLADGRDLTSPLKENGQEPEDLQFSPKHLASLIELAEAGSVNNQVAKRVFEQIFAEDVDPEAYVEEHGLKTVTTPTFGRNYEKVLENNPGPVEQYKSGRQKSSDFWSARS